MDVEDTPRIGDLVRFRPLYPTIGLLAFLTGGVVQAQRVSASVSRAVVTLEAEFLLEVVVEGAQDVQLQLPNFEENFSWRAEGLRSQTVIVNNRISRGETHTFALAAKRLGALVIAPPPSRKPSGAQPARVPPCRPR